LQSPFEQIYLKLRQYEHRVYSDEVVKELPFLLDGQLLKISSIKKEWKIRSRSTKKLISYLKKKPLHSILEVGSGNGWLSNRLAMAFPTTTILATDINESELLQGQRVFGAIHPNLKFELVDIFSDALHDHSFDCVIVAGSIQYFPDLRKAINTLLEMLNSKGEIHLLDSPFYSTLEINKAKRRSEVYFEECGCSEMKHYYHHHLWKDLENFNFGIAYDPHSSWNRLGQKINNDSPFPWVIIS